MKVKDKNQKKNENDFIDKILDPILERYFKKVKEDRKAFAQDNENAKTSF